MTEERAEAIEIPERLLKRPMFRGMPIPYTTLVIDGKPDFKTTDEGRRIGCLGHNLCGLCGELLGGYTAFMGGTKSVKERLFLDAGMHLECAEYAFAVCPHYTGRTDYRETDPDLHYKGVEIGVAEEVFIYVTEAWQVVLLNGLPVIEVGEPTKLISKKRVPHGRCAETK